LSRYGYIDPKDALAISEDPEANEALPEDEEVTIIDGDSRTLNQVVEDLGFESDDEPEFEDEAEDKSETMTIEKACTIKNSEGKPYFGLSVKSLNNIKANLLQYIEGNEIDPEQNAEIQEKLAAIKVLLKAKAEGSIQ
jgi:hypothetical protein